MGKKNRRNDLDRQAYEMYCRHTGGVSLATGEQLPGWDDLPEEIRAAWRFVVRQLIGLMVQVLSEQIIDELVPSLIEDEELFETVRVDQ